MHKIWVCSLCDHAAIYECIFLDPFNHNWQSVKLDKNEGFRKMLVFEKQKKTSFRLIATVIPVLISLTLHYILHQPHHFGF